MEILLALMFPATLGAMVVGLLTFLRSQEGQRSLKIAQSNLTPVADIESGYAAVAASIKALRRAKQEEHQLLLRNWQSKYLELLPATDPEKTTYQAQLQGIKIQTAAFELDATGMRAKDQILPVEDGPEWAPLPYKKTKKDPDEAMSYNDRRIQSAGAFVRTEPHTDAAFYGVASGGEIVRFDGYVHGQAVAGSTIWFVSIGKHSGLRKYVHSIATTDRSTSGMRNLTTPNITYSGGSQAIQMSTTEVARKLAEEVTMKSKYNAAPKTKIPSTLTKIWY